ncbi:MAG: hypothetical protein QXZ17_14680 [Nitrososphaerota archaeon]
MEEVLSVFKKVDSEIPYRDSLKIYIKKFERKDNYSFIKTLMDVKKEIKIKVREGGEIRINLNYVQSCEEINFAYFPRISGSSVLDHCVVVLGPEYMAKILADAIEKIVGQEAFLRVKFNFSASNEGKIRNFFDDIKRIKGENILDPYLRGLSIEGTMVYRTGEYQKALTGEVKSLGLALGNDWFIVSSIGKITTYRRLSDEDFIEKIREVLIRLLRSGAVVL